MWSSLRQIVFLDLDYNYYIWLLDDWLKSSSRNNVLFIAVLKIHFLAVSDVSVTLFVFVFSLYHTSPGDIVVPEYSFRTALIWSKGGSLGAQRGTVWADGTCQLQWRRTEKAWFCLPSAFPSDLLFLRVPFFIKVVKEHFVVKQKWEYKIAWIYSCSQKARFHKMSNRLRGKLLKSCFVLFFCLNKSPFSWSETYRNDCNVLSGQ